MMTTAKLPTSERIAELLEKHFSMKADNDTSLTGWLKAARLLNSMDIEGAALQASLACSPGLMNDPFKTMLLNSISNLAVANKITGSSIESMWATAADFGYHDLAYNAANEIYEKARTPGDYKLASRYYQIAIEKSKHKGVVASAITNSAGIVRDGNITGKKDWAGAVALYEKAAAMNLVNAMFNAGNVLLWMVEAGDKSHGDRAAAWFEKIIAFVDSGAESIDLGGQPERDHARMSSAVRLAQMHLNSSLSNPDLNMAEQLIAPYMSEPYAQWVKKSLDGMRLSKSVASPSSSAGENWKSVLTLNGWVIEDSYPFDYGKLGALKLSGTMLEFRVEDSDQTAESLPLYLMVFDYFTHPEIDTNSAAMSIAMDQSEKMGCAVFYAGAKAFFIRYGEKMYNILHVAQPTKSGIAPIWAGATTLDVLQTLKKSLEARFAEAVDDPSNTIPRLVNALDEGFTLDGSGLPNAIWLGADNVLCFPIHRADEPVRQGISISHTTRDLEVALANNLKNRP